MWSVSGCVFFFVRIRRLPRATRTDTLFPTRRASDLRDVAERVGLADIGGGAADHDAEFDFPIGLGRSPGDDDRIVRPLDAAYALGEQHRLGQIGRAHV